VSRPCPCFDTPCIGRTHGVHAEPITFGVKILVWYDEACRHLRRVDQALETIGYGRIQGAVGTYIHLDPEVEIRALEKLGLTPARVSTQVLQRDRHAEVLYTLALICATLDKVAQEIRHLQKTEAREVEDDGAQLSGVLLYMPSLDETIFSKRGAILSNGANAKRIVLEDGLILSNDTDRASLLRFHGVGHGDRVATRLAAARAPLVFEGSHRNAPALALFTHQAVSGNMRIREERLCETVFPREFADRNRLDSGHFHGREEEAQTRVFVSRIWNAAGQQDHVLRVVAVGRPCLGAVDHPLIPDSHRARLGVAEIRAILGLGKSLTPDILG